MTYKCKIFKHYKKSGTWFVDSEIDCPQVFKRVTVSFRETIICVSEFNNIYILNFNEKSFKLLLEHSSGFNDVCMVYPMGTEFVTLAHNKEVALWRIDTGILVKIN